MNYSKGENHLTPSQALELARERYKSLRWPELWVDITNFALVACGFLAAVAMVGRGEGGTGGLIFVGTLILASVRVRTINLERRSVEGTLIQATLLAKLIQQKKEAESVTP